MDTENSSKTEVLTYLLKIEKEKNFQVLRVAVILGISNLGLNIAAILDSDISYTVIGGVITLCCAGFYASKHRELNAKLAGFEDAQKIQTKK